jgi:hypothetical protein
LESVDDPYGLDESRTHNRKGANIMDFSNMTVSDWVIRTAIFGVLACAVLGALQNLFDAIKTRKTDK